MWTNFSLIMQTKNNNQYAADTVAAVSTENQISASVTHPLEPVIRFRYEVHEKEGKETIGETFKQTLPVYTNKMTPQPLYNDAASIPGSTTSAIQQMHTHSNKFPIKREVILGNYDKNSKIPILNDYHKKHKDSISASDVLPNIQVAWIEDRTSGTVFPFSELRNAHPNLNVTDNTSLEFYRNYKASPLSLPDGTKPCSISSEANSSQSAIKMDSAINKAFTSRTYNTIKDMISSRFGKGKIDQFEINLNNSENQRNESPSPIETKSDSSTSAVTKIDNISSCLRSQLVQADELQQQNSVQLVDKTRSSDTNQKVATISNMAEYRERGVDTDDRRIIDDNERIHEFDTAPPMRMISATANSPTVSTQPPPMERTDEASNQRQDRNTKCESTNSSCRDMSQCQNDRDKAARFNETGESTRSAPCSFYIGQHNVVNSQRVYEDETVAAAGEYPLSRVVDQHRIRKNLISNDITDGVELGRSNSPSLYGHKDPSIRRNPGSLENLGNMDKIEQFKTNTPPSRLTFDDEKYIYGGGHSDSGRGSTTYSSGKLKHTTDTSPDLSEPHRTSNYNGLPIAAGRDNQRMLKNNLKHILEQKLNRTNNSMLSQSSTLPPLPSVLPDISSDEMKPSSRQKGLLYGSVIEISHKTAANSSHTRHLWPRTNTKEKMNQQLAVTAKKPENSSNILSPAASSSIDLDSMFDEQYDDTSDEEISSNDNSAIRKQLESLENMYSEVMKLLRIKKTSKAIESRSNWRGLYGSVSSLPSSVSSRPIRDRHRRSGDRKRFVRDINGINKRFQRLESHVVTLARSVAHLSCEMRTQHIMIREMESIRVDLTNLRTQTNALMVRTQSISHYNRPQMANKLVNANPHKMKKLTKFFGDEPPLLALFLKKLGYEKYGSLFEKEQIGLVELPYMTEERLQKLGIPMGPRLRIIQEARLGFPGMHENTLCII